MKANTMKLLLPTVYGTWHNTRAFIAIDSKTIAEKDEILPKASKWSFEAVMYMRNGACHYSLQMNTFDLSYIDDNGKKQVLLANHVMNDYNRLAPSFKFEVKRLTEKKRQELIEDFTIWASEKLPAWATQIEEALTANK